MDVQLRLEVKRKFVLNQRLAQIAFQSQTVLCFVVHFLRKEEIAVRRGIGGGAQSHVGVVHQLVRIGVVIGKNRNADVRADVDFRSAQKDRRQHGFDHRPRVHRRRFGVGNVFDHHREFVPADAGDEPFDRRLFQQTFGDDFQQIVPRRVSQSVVDAVEVRQIREQDGDFFLARRRPFQNLAQLVVEQTAVRQPRQLVVIRQMQNLSFGVFAFRHVVAHDHAVRQVSVRVQNRRNAFVDGVQRSRFVAFDDFAVPALPRAQDVPHFLVKRFVLLSGALMHQLVFQHFFAPVAALRAKGVVHPQRDAPFVRDDESVRRHFQRRAL